MGGSEGGLDAPTRHPLAWRDDAFHDPVALEAELERVFDICHGCRRCVSLCDAFPTLFDLVDASSTLEVDGVAKSDFGKVVEQCYLCDLCYQTKCPYVPPHEWNVDFPHLMLRAKAVAFRQAGAPASRRLLTRTTAVGKLASIPVVTQAVNAANGSPTMRKLLDRTLGVHPKASVPTYHGRTARKRIGPAPAPAEPNGKVAVFVTCYGNYNMPQVVEDLVAVLRHNRLDVALVEQERCCGMPKMELGDLASVDALKQFNLPVLSAAVAEDRDIVTPIPSCALMFRQEIPLMYPDDAAVQAVKARIRDPFELLMQLHRAGRMNTTFPNALGTVAYHAPCHQRVQNIGPKTREVLSLVPGTEVTAIERCSGHDGTYGVRSETYDRSARLLRPVLRRVEQASARFVSSDCPMAGDHIAHHLSGDHSPQPLHPVSLLRRAYGI